MGNFRRGRRGKQEFVLSEKSSTRSALVNIFSFNVIFLFFNNPYLDELIRQITINCAERGLLLLRVRDEARMTVSSYETLYESSIAYGIRKALMAEQRRTELEAKIKSLDNAKADLFQQIDNLKSSMYYSIATTRLQSFKRVKKYRL